MVKTKNSPKSLERRCPRLGGPVHFLYCKTCEPNKRVCGKIIDCWWETFDVVRYLYETLPKDQFEALLRTVPKNKVTSILEILNKTGKQGEEK